MTTIVKAKCNVETTKSDKWLRLAPVEKGALPPLVIASTALNGAKAVTVTITEG